MFSGKFFFSATDTLVTEIKKPPKMWKVYDDNSDRQRTYCDKKKAN